MAQTSFGIMPIGFPGQRVGMDHNADTYINDKGYLAEVVDITVTPLVAQVSTVTVTGTTDGTYSVTINGTTYSFVASSNTASQIATGLAAAINNSAVTDVASTNTVVLTSTVAGTPFTVTVAGAGTITVATGTANFGSSSTVSFVADGNTVSFTSSSAVQTVGSIRDGLVNAFRAVLALEDVASASAYSTNKIRITNKVPGNTTTVTESDANLTLATIQAASAPEVLVFGSAVVKSANGDKSCKVPTAASQEFLGIVERVHTNINPNTATAGKNSVVAFSTASIGRKGKYLVQVDVAVAPGDSAYFRHTASGSKVPGSWGNVADSATCDIVPNGAGKFRSTASAGGLAVLELNLP